MSGKHKDGQVLVTVWLSAQEIEWLDFSERVFGLSGRSAVLRKAVGLVYDMARVWAKSHPTPNR